MEFLQTVIIVIVFMAIILPAILFAIISYYQWLFKTVLGINMRRHEKQYRELAVRRDAWKRIKNNASDALTLADAQKMIDKLEAQMRKALL